MKELKIQGLGLEELNKEEICEINGGIWPIIIGCSMILIQLGSKAFDLGREYAREN